MARYICGLLLIVVILLIAITAFAESAEEMLSACRPITKAKITDDRVQLPQDIKSGMCWGAFGVIQEVIRHLEHNGNKTFYRVCARQEAQGLNL